ncbi:hypothetical protein pb186bvf_006828 [Paramecium bursaria]
MNQIMTGYYNWIKIFSYLSPDDIFSCDHVCQQFRNILSSNYDQIKVIFEDYTYKSLYHLNWYTNRIKLIKIQRINIMDYDALLSDSEIEYMIEGLELKSLKIINCKFKFKPYILEKLIHLEELELGTKCIKQDQLSYFSNVKQLSIQPEKFKLSLGLLYLKNLVSLQIRSIKLDYYSLIKLLEQNYNTLQQLYLEAEQFDRYKMNKIISSLNPEILTAIHLFYFEDYHDEHIYQLTNFKKLNDIQIRKAEVQNSFSYVKFLQFKSFLKVNFEQCDQFDDQCLDILTSSSPQLVYVNIAWTQCTNEPVQRLFLNCLQLKEVNLAGMKQLNDNCFPQEDNWNRILKKCKALSFNKCNNVSDYILKKLKSQKLYIVIVNYHDVEM